jgi:mannose-6-phosphate isomerase-like protein (cupin superfamily)
LVHHVARADDIRLAEAAQGHARGYRRASVIDRSVGSVHTGLSLCELDAGGHLDTHVQSYEEQFFVTDGAPVLVFDGDPVELAPGACGVIPVGTPHAWRGPATGTARWIELNMPIPREAGPRDCFFLGSPPDAPARPLDIRDPRNRHFFRMAETDIDVDKLKVGAKKDAPTVSASMATALLVYSGVAVKMLVDQRMSAALGQMFMVDYQAGGLALPHDHPLEEAYVILDGEVEFVADGGTYKLREGDVCWTGVGCIHAFYNRTDGRIRFLESQSPQPPARHSYRFDRDWDYLEDKLGKA